MPSPPPRRARTSRAGPAAKAAGAAAAAAAVNVVLVVAVTVVEQHGSPPGCYGIGWGCTPGPVASGALWGMFAVVPALVVVSAVLALTVALPSHTARRRAAAAVAVVVVVAAVGTPLAHLWTAA